MAKYHGKRGRIELGAGSPFDIICSMKSWAISFTKDSVDATTFCNTNKTYLDGLKDVTGSFGGLFDTDDVRALFDASEAADGTVIRITPSVDAGEYYFQGPASIDISMGGSMTDAVTLDVTFKAKGDWTIVLGGSPV